MTAVDNSDINHGHFELVECIVFCAIVPVFVLARFASRMVSKQLGWDDWAALGAGAFALSCNIQTIIAIQHGWGRHITNLTPSQLSFVLLLHWSFQLTYKITVALNKLSILFLYLRILPSPNYRLLIHLLFTFVLLFGLSTTIAGIFQCVPVSKAWQRSQPGHCYNLVAAWYTNAVFSIVTDFIILIIPMHMVYNLQRDKREKVLLYFVFGIGGFVTFTSIMRFFALKDAGSRDATFDVNSGFWSVIEINIGVICICLPPLRALLSRRLKFLKEARSGVGEGSSGRPYPLGYLRSGEGKEGVGSLGASAERPNVGPYDHQQRIYPEDRESEEELVFQGTVGDVKHPVELYGGETEDARSGGKLERMGMGRSRDRSQDALGMRGSRDRSRDGLGMDGISKTTQIVIRETSMRQPINSEETEPKDVRDWKRQMRGSR